MGFVVWNHSQIGRIIWFFEQFVDIQVPRTHFILRPMQMATREVKMRCLLLLLYLIPIQKLHMREHRACHCNHELWHYKGLTLLFSLSLHFLELGQWRIHVEALRINYLRDVVKVAEKDAALGEAEHPIERPP